MSQKYFPPEDKAAVQELVKNLMSAFRVRIDKLAWMSPQTKASAHAKLDAMVVGIGYPDHWRSYEGLDVIRGDAFGNAGSAPICFNIIMGFGEAG